MDAHLHCLLIVLVGDVGLDDLDDGSFRPFVFINLHILNGVMDIGGNAIHIMAKLPYLLP